MIDRETNLPLIFKRNRYKILGAALIAALAAAGLSLLLPDRYQSTAAIMVRDPELPLVGEERPLNIESLRELVDSITVKKELFDQIGADQLAAQQVTGLREFLRLLRVSTERKSMRDQSLVPIIRLTAETRDAEFSKAIANRWTEIVLAKTRALYSGGVGELGTFIGGVYQQAHQALLDSEARHTSAVLSANLTVRRAQLEQKQSIYTALYNETLVLSEELNLAQKLTAELEAQIAGQEVGGSWAGEYYDRAYRAAAAREVTAPTTDTIQIQKAIQSLIQNEQLIAQFEEESRLKFLLIDQTNKEKQLAHISEQILISRNRLAQAEQLLQALNGELESLPPKITLNRAITDDAAWDAYLQGRLKDPQQLPLMKSEELNPVYQSVKQNVINLKGEVSGLKGRIDYFDNQKNVLEKEVNALSRDISAKEAHLQALRSAVKKDKELLSYLEHEFNKLRQRLDGLRRNSKEIQVKLNSKSFELVRLEQDVHALQREIEFSADTITALEREVAGREAVAVSLAAKANETALLKIAVEKAGRSGITLLYTAEANPEKVGPRRVRIVLGSALLAALCAFAWLAFDAAFKEA